MPSTRGAAGPPPAKPPPPASTASSSSLSSGRQDRNARLNAAQDSATPQSRSSEEMSEPPRRSQRSHPTKKDDAGKDRQDVDDEAVEEEEEEVTRCICGQQDYPGPALSDVFNAGDAPPEDAGGLFISCDGCSVWQHGGCVGIFEESQVPDKYYCEECKPKLHELHIDSRGQNYSLYQPVYAKSSRKPSISKHGDKTKQDQELAALRASADPATGKRRATMRSKEHDDEEEQMRRAIEESKRELGGSAGGNGNGRRNGKRAREDNEDQKMDIKRPRRASELAPASSKADQAVEDSGDESSAMHVSKGKKARADAVQSVRQAELREKEKERDKLRAEAAGRRQERAGRRRADDEAEEEMSRTSASMKTSPPPSSQPESPPPAGPSERNPLKKGPGKKTKKLGNNQYTKLRGAPTSSPPNGKKSHSNSNGQGTSSGDEPLPNGDGHQKGSGTNKNSPERITAAKGKFGKGKGKVNPGGAKHSSEDPSDLSMATMKRRMDAMAAFIAKAKVELKGDRTPGATPKANAEETNNGDYAAAAAGATSSGLAAEGSNEESWKTMNAMELAEVVSGQIADWQHRFAHVV